MGTINKTSRWGQFGRHILLLLASIIMIYPLLWMIGSAFKPEAQIFTNPGALPTEFKLDNFIDGWSDIRNRWNWLHGRWMATGTRLATVILKL